MYQNTFVALCLFSLCMLLAPGCLLDGAAKKGKEAAGTVSAALPPLEGTWVANGCGTGSDILTFTFAAGVFTETNQMFTDNTCATPMITLVKMGTYSIGAAAAAPADSVKIDYAQTSELATPDTGSSAMLNGPPAQCVGVTFVDHVASDVSGQDCNKGILETANGATIYGIYSLLTAGTLQLGSASGTDRKGNAAEIDRPSTLDSSRTFTKL